MEVSVYHLAKVVQLKHSWPLQWAPGTPRPLCMNHSLKHTRLSSRNHGAKWVVHGQRWKTLLSNDKLIWETDSSADTSLHKQYFRKNYAAVVRNMSTPFFCFLELIYILVRFSSGTARSKGPHQRRTLWKAFYYGFDRECQRTFILMQQFVVGCMHVVGSMHCEFTFQPLNFF